jgi:hypothetical protein
MALELGGGGLRSAMSRSTPSTAGWFWYVVRLATSSNSAMLPSLRRNCTSYVRTGSAPVPTRPRKRSFHSGSSAGAIDALERQAGELLALVAEALQQQPVGVDEAEVLRDEDAVGQRVHQRAVGALADAQRLLDAARLGDVGHRQQAAGDARPRPRRAAARS